MNSVSEGLWYGVPLIPIPQQIEQAIVAREIEKHGAGIALGTKPPFGVVTAPKLRSAADRILSQPDTYRAVAKRLGDSFRVAGGPARAVDVILEFTKHR